MAITLERLRDEDSDALYRWINDREVVELSAAFRPVSRDDHEAWLARALNSPGTFAIREDGRLVGSCQLIEDPDAPGEAELRIRLGEADARGRGVGTQAMRLLLAHGFGSMGLRRVHLQVFASNARAIRSYEKAGFTRASGAEAPIIRMSSTYAQFSRGAGSAVPSSSDR